MDSIRRRWIGGPLPPRRLLQRVQMTPWIDEYLRIGEISHRVIVDALARHGVGGGRALDFGCGLGRTLRLFGQALGGDRDPAWELHGCDVDAALVDWSRGAFPGVDVRRSAEDPPLPWPDGTFDALWSVSVFTHFPRERQSIWAEELGRVLRPGGLAVITTMGPHALGGFAELATDAHRQTLAREGFFFQPGTGELGEFNANGAFHTEEGLRRIFEGSFELEEWRQGGLDGFQDLSVLRRTGS